MVGGIAEGAPLDVHSKSAGPIMLGLLLIIKIVTTQLNDVDSMHRLNVILRAHRRVKGVRMSIFRRHANNVLAADGSCIRS